MRRRILIKLINLVKIEHSKKKLQKKECTRLCQTVVSLSTSTRSADRTCCQDDAIELDWSYSVDCVPILDGDPCLEDDENLLPVLPPPLLLLRLADEETEERKCLTNRTPATISNTHNISRMLRKIV